MRMEAASSAIARILLAGVLLVLACPALAGTPGQAKYDFRVSDSPGVVNLNAPALARDNTMYVGGEDGFVYAIGPDGTIKWVYEAGSPVTTNAAVYYSPDDEHAQYNGTIYVGLEDGRVLALDPAGNRKWTFDAGSPINASPALAADGTIYVGKDPAVLVAIRPNGKHRWSRSLPGSEGLHDPVVGPDGTIYFGNRQTHDFYAYDSAGARVWSIHMLGGIRSSAAIGQDGTIYFACGHSLQALWPNGDPKWDFSFGLDVSLYAAPVIGHQGTIYMSADHLVAVNPDGSWEWDFWYDGEWPRVIRSVAVDSSGLIYAPGFDGEIFCIAPGGTFVWRYGADGNWLSAPVVGSDGLLYSADYSRVRALYTGATGPFAGPWPMHRRDAACSARLGTYWQMMIEVENMAMTVGQSGLNKGTKVSLRAKLDATAASLETRHILPAAHELGAFIHQVEALEGKSISPEIADRLIRDALHVLTLADGDHLSAGPSGRQQASKPQAAPRSGCIQEAPGR